MARITKYATNPLVVPRELVFKTRSVQVRSGKDITDNETGEIHSVSAVYQRKIVDSERFAKLYVDGITKTFELSASARKVFGVVLKVCAKDSDRIYINFMQTKEIIDDELNKFGERTFHRGMQELIEKGFIAASQLPSMFWINPHLFFNGDRVRFITEFVKENEHEKVPALEKKPRGRPRKEVTVLRDPNTVDLLTGKTDSEGGAK